MVQHGQEGTTLREDGLQTDPLQSQTVVLRLVNLVLNQQSHLMLDSVTCIMHRQDYRLINQTAVHEQQFSLVTLTAHREFPVQEGGSHRSDLPTNTSQDSDENLVRYVHRSR